MSNSDAHAHFPAPATAGRGTARSAVGGASGFDDLSCVRQRSVDSEAPSTTLRGGPPPALSRGRMHALVLAMRLGIRGLLSRFKKARPTRPNKMKGAERRKARTYWPCPAGPGARHANECCHSSALRARSPFGAPPRHSPRRTHPDIGSALSPALPETRRIRALPSATCLSLPRSAETGRSAGRAVTRGRPGAVCETARGNRTCSTF